MKSTIIGLLIFEELSNLQLEQLSKILKQYNDQRRSFLHCDHGFDIPACEIARKFGFSICSHPDNLYEDRIFINSHVTHHPKDSLARNYDIIDKSTLLIMTMPLQTNKIGALTIVYASTLNKDIRILKESKQHCPTCCGIHDGPCSPGNFKVIICSCGNELVMPIDSINADCVCGKNKWTEKTATIDDMIKHHPNLYRRT